MDYCGRMKKASFVLYLFVVLLVNSPLAASPLMGFGCPSEISMKGSEAKRLFEKADPVLLSHHILSGWNSSARRYFKRSFYIHYSNVAFFYCSAPDVDDWMDQLTCICPDARYQFFHPSNGLSTRSWAAPLDHYVFALKMLYRDHLKTMSEEKQIVWMQRAYRDGFWRPDNFDPNSRTNLSRQKWRPSLPEFP